ncbi:hypothetical protein RAD16_10220 [Bradyrhizobium sp. 18BD]
MSIYSYDHAILARSREVIRQSLELLRWSETFVRQHWKNQIGEGAEPQNATFWADAANDRRSFD